MQRLPAPQQITWFLDLDNLKQLNLNPPYQRRSVWTLKDRQFFLDTIFRNYPCPAVFIHKETDKDGKTTYNVVDGKQRLQTILMFKNSEISLSKDFGDVTLNGKKFSELTGDQKKKFWDYIVVVDFVDLKAEINEVFDRLNRNSKNLNDQELRHAKYAGWFITESEKEAENKFWEDIGVSTKARVKRMKDVQFLSELLMVIIEKKVVGFDQEHINELYASFDNPIDDIPDFNEDTYLNEKERIRKYLEKMESVSNPISDFASTVNNLYSLWALIALNKPSLPDSKVLAKKYTDFMNKVNAMTDATDFNRLSDTVDKLAYEYFSNSRGASTDLKQRQGRLDALKKAVL